MSVGGMLCSSKGVPSHSPDRTLGNSNGYRKRKKLTILLEILLIATLPLPPASPQTVQDSM
jgi:hypothetical protein